MSLDKLDIAITPSGTYNCHVAVLADELPGLDCWGGFAIKIFRGSDYAPIYSRTIQLFEVHSPRHSDSFNLNGPIATAAEPADPGTFGPLYLAPIIAHLHPGVRLVFWLYAWIKVGGTLDPAWFGAVIETWMPAMTVCAAPPVVVR